MATVLAKRRREFGERLRTERERLGYTELQIAQLLGVPLKCTKSMSWGKKIREFSGCPDSTTVVSIFSSLSLVSATIPLRKKVSCWPVSENSLTVEEILFSWRLTLSSVLLLTCVKPFEISGAINSALLALQRIAFRAMFGKVVLCSGQIPCVLSAKFSGWSAYWRCWQLAASLPCISWLPLHPFKIVCNRP